MKKSVKKDLCRQIAEKLPPYLLERDEFVNLLRSLINSGKGKDLLLVHNDGKLAPLAKGGLRGDCIVNNPTTAMLSPTPSIPLPSREGTREQFPLPLGEGAVVYDINRHPELVSGSHTFMSPTNAGEGNTLSRIAKIRSRSLSNSTLSQGERTRTVSSLGGGCHEVTGEGSTSFAQQTEKDLPSYRPNVLTTSKKLSRFTPHSSRKRCAFTLAEMMVVMLIASIILACMAPAITTRIKMDQSSNQNTSPWKWAENNADAYFSNNDGSMAMIGQNEKADTDSAKLIVNNSTGLDDMILFKNGANVLGHLRFANGGVLLGNLPSGVDNIGNNAVAIGNGASASDNESVAIGQSATASSPDTGATIALGSSSNATGSGATALGSGSKASDYGSIALGYSSSATGLASVSIGNSKATGQFSIAIASGNNEGYEVTTPSTTEATGDNALVIGNGAAVESANSIAIGNNVNVIKTGYDNTGSIAIGNDIYLKGYGPNTVIGYQVMPKILSETGYSGRNANTLIGYQVANHLTTGGLNTAIGHQALYSDTTGTGNVAIGLQALYSDTTGSNNVAIGKYACKNVLGSNKTCIGSGSGPLTTDDLAKSSNTDKVIFLGDADTTVYIPGNLRVDGNVELAVNTNSRIKVRAYGSNNTNVFNTMFRDTEDLRTNSTTSTTPSLPSDRRLKNVGKEFASGLDKIRQLKIFNYTYKDDKEKTPHVGVIAQDLQKIFPNAVKKGADGFLRIRMEDMFYAVINAIKELDAKYQAQEKRINELEKRIEKLEARSEK